MVALGAAASCCVGAAAITTLRGGVATAVLLLLLTLKIKFACQHITGGYLEGWGTLVPT